MTANSYLTSLTSALVLKGSEEDSINSSIPTLKIRLSANFGTGLREQFKFGSSTRGTILPRKADEQSDIDYMIVFSTSSGAYKPQAYLDQLRRFSERYYSASEIHQTHPTITLELNHIKFDLVPATYNYGYQIPSPASSWSDWMATDPNGFNQQLTSTNINNKSQIKPLVRSIKYWNALNGHHFSSFDLENHIVRQMYWGSSYLIEFFHTFWNSFSCSYDTAQYVKDKVQRAKDRVSTIQQYQRQGYESLAEDELRKLLPAI